MMNYPEELEIRAECEESWPSEDMNGPIGWSDDCGWSGDVKAELDDDEFYKWTCPRCKTVGFTHAEDVLGEDSDAKTDLRDDR